MSTSQLAEQLAGLLRDGHGTVDQVKQMLNEFEMQKVAIIDYHVQGWTSVHLAAKNGMNDCLKLLLRYGGKQSTIKRDANISTTGQVNMGSGHT